MAPLKTAVDLLLLRKAEKKGSERVASENLVQNRQRRISPTVFIKAELFVHIFHI